MNNLEKDNKTGLWYRPEKGELHVLREQNQYKAIDFEGKRVMDVGANIGAFTHLALTNGACAVNAYEPMPETFDVLKLNIEKMFENTSDLKAEVNIDNVALVYRLETPTIDFYLSHKYPSCNTMIPVRGRETIQVECLGFWDEMRDFKPEVLKIDIEGGEYSLKLPDEGIPDYVEQIAIELHMSKKGSVEKALQIVGLFEDWHVHRKFKFNWHVTTLVLHRTKHNMGTVKQWMKNIQIQK
jgi:FkbM family methyltransferase